MLAVWDDHHEWVKMTILCNKEVTNLEIIIIYHEIEVTKKLRILDDQLKKISEIENPAVSSFFDMQRK
jgi:hypothetical protein